MPTGWCAIVTGMQCIQPQKSVLCRHCCQCSHCYTYCGGSLLVSECLHYLRNAASEEEQTVQWEIWEDEEASTLQSFLSGSHSSWLSNSFESINSDLPTQKHPQRSWRGSLWKLASHAMQISSFQFAPTTVGFFVTRFFSSASCQVDQSITSFCCSDFHCYNSGRFSVDIGNTRPSHCTWWISCFGDCTISVDNFPFSCPAYRFTRLKHNLHWKRWRPVCLLRWWS